MKTTHTVQARTAYGVDISETEAIVVRATRKGWRLIERLELQPDCMAGVAGLAAGEHGLVAVATPVKKSFTQWIDAPFSSLPKARRVFDSLLDLRIPFPVENCVRGYIEIGHNPLNNVEALAVGAGSDSIVDLLERLAALGIDPEVVDHEGLALWTLAEREYPPQPDKHRAVAYVGEDRFVIALGKTGRFELARNTDLQIDADGIGADQLERISRRLARIVASDAGTGDMEIVWCGPRAQDNGIRIALAAAIGLASACGHIVVDDPAPFLARALAVRALSGGLNLRSGDLEHARLRSAARRRESLLASSALAAGILLCMGNLIWSGLMEKRQAEIQAHLNSRALEITGMAQIPKGMEVEVVRNRIDALRPQLDRLNRLFLPSSGNAVARIAGFAAEEDMFLGALEIRGGQLSISGSAVDWDSCRRLSDFVADLGYSVELEREDAGADERVHFGIDGETDEA